MSETAFPIVFISVVAFATIALALAAWWSFLRRRQWNEAAATAESARAQALDRILDAAPDGWFAWFDATAENNAARSETRTDQKPPSSLTADGVCSRRLAVLLALYAGRDSAFDAVLAAFPESEAQRLRKAVENLRENGETFELIVSRQIDALDAARQERQIWARGLRATDDIGVALADVVWMRDVSAEQAGLERALARSRSAEEESARLRCLLDGVPMPLWLRDGDLRVMHANQSFFDVAPGFEDSDAAIGNAGAAEAQGGRALRALASAARASGQARSADVRAVVGGERRLMRVSENPAIVLNSAGEEARFTVGMALDVTELEAMRATMEREAASQAEVLERLGTAIAIFGADTSLRFHNTAFARLWRLESGTLRQDPPTYAELLETWRKRRMLPEVVDYRAFRKKELDRFSSLSQPVEDLQHLPDGKTLRRVLAPYPMGGLLATYEDVTDRLALEARLSQGLAVQRHMIDPLREGVAVFGADGRLRLCNPAFAQLTGVEGDCLEAEPHVSEIMARPMLFPSVRPLWEALREHLASPPQERTLRRSRVEREDGVVLNAIGASLPDGGMLLICSESAGIPA